jgi:hypothetical protein
MFAAAATEMNPKLIRERRQAPLQGADHARCDARGMPIHAHRCAKGLEPEWVGKAAQQIGASSSLCQNRELDYRLIKEVWAFHENRIAVRFAYEWHDDAGYWFRSYGNENWEFDEHGLMRFRIASINDVPIKESERKYRWPLGRRPDDHPSLSDLGL